MKYLVTFAHVPDGWSAWLTSHPQFVGIGKGRAEALADVRAELFEGLNDYVIEHEALPRPDATAAGHMIKLDFGLVEEALTDETKKLIPRTEPVGVKQ